MPEELGFKLSIDPGNSGNTIGELKKELAAAKDKAAEISMQFGASSQEAQKAAAYVKEVSTALNPTVEKAKSFKQEFREAKELMIQAARTFGEFSPEAIAAAAAVGKLKDEMSDSVRLADNLTDENRFKAFAGFTSSLAGGFQAVQGAITLATGGSKEFEAAMLKLQAAMALSHGLGQLADIGRQFNEAKAALMSFTAVQKAYSIATGAAAVVQKLFTGAVETTSTGFKILRGAIISTGIGALAVAIGYVVENFSSLKQTIYKLLPFLETVEKFVSKVVTATTDLVGITSASTRAADGLRAGIESQNDAMGNQVKILEASGAKSKEVRDLKNKMYDDEIAKIQQIQKLGSGTDDDAKKLKDLQFQKQLLNAEAKKQAADDADKAHKKADEEHKKATEEAKQKAKQKAEQAKKDKAEAEKAAEDSFQAVVDSQKSKNEFEIKLLEAQGKSVKGVREKQIDEEIELLKLGGKKYDDAIVELEREKVLTAAEARRKAQEEQAQRDLDDMEADVKRQQQEDEVRKQLTQGNKALKDKKAGKTAEEQANEDAKAAEIDAVQQKYDAMKEVVKTNEELLTDVVRQEAEAKAAVVKKFDDITLAQKRDNAGKLASVLGNLSAVVGKETAVGKGLAVAEATISTYLGAAKALAGINTATPFGAAMAIANATAIIGAGLKSVQEIVKVKVPTTSGGGASSTPGASVAAASTSPAMFSAPTTDGIQTTLIDQTKQLQQGREPLKAYVVESEITQKQELQKAIINTANF